MEQSPLTHQPRPEVFQPKIVQLYDELLLDPDHIPGEGFWAEFFLLRPDCGALRARLDHLTAADLLAFEVQTRHLFSRAVALLLEGGHGSAPLLVNGHRRNGSLNGVNNSHAWSNAKLDSSSHNATGQPITTVSTLAIENTLDTLTTFLSTALAKKYTSPSADIIDLLAGLDRVDAVLSDFVMALDLLLRHGRTDTIRSRSVDVALAVTAGAYQTTLLTYFIQRDLFPSIIRVITDTPNAVSSFTLVGLLANYNKFEFQNPYQLRLNDFVNEQAIRTVLWGVGDACCQLRAQYLDIQDDLPEGWTLASTLSMIGFGSSGTAQKPAYDIEKQKQMFAKLPGDEAAVLLATYDFAHANKLFCFNLVRLGPRPLPATNSNAASSSGKHVLANSSSSVAMWMTDPPMANFISLASYLSQNAYRSPRTTLYTHLCLMVFRLLVEDPALCKHLCSSDDDKKITVRLCRQRPPHLPLVKSPRSLAACILDVMVDGITHNLRRRLDVGLYTQCLGIMLRLVAYLSRTRTRLPYSHWPELFRALLGLIRFITTYASDLQGGGAGAPVPQHLDTLVDHVVNLLSLGLSAGEAFLPTPAAYDDLFYKVVEAGDALEKFKDTYHLGNGKGTSSIDTLLSVNAHYKRLLSEGAKGGKGGRVKGTTFSSSSSLTSLQVAEVIKQGYETLSIEATEGLDTWEKYREADERTLLKKMARTAVTDVKHYIEVHR